MKPRLRNAAKAIIIRDGHLLTTNNHGSSGDTFYLVPGGGQEPGETLTETVRRECWEEIGGKINVGQLTFVREYIGANHEFAEYGSYAHGVDVVFACTLTTDPETLVATSPNTYQIGIEWQPLATLHAYLLYPQAVKPLIPEMATMHCPDYLGNVN